MPNLTPTTPISFGAEVPAAEADLDEAGVRRISEIFEAQLGQYHPGAQLVILRHGRVVLDRAAGLAHRGRHRPVTADTPFFMFSIAKAFTAMGVHHLLEQGKLDWDTPIAAYWPEFGCHGKEKATIRHTLLHQAGIPARGMVAQVPLWPSWPLVTRNVARTKAEFEPGSQTAYHWVNYGFILGEVVRRVSGRSIDKYLEDVFFKPLGFKNSYLGLPWREQSRAAKLYAGYRDQASAVCVFNLPVIRHAVIPAATLHSSAREVAVFFQMLLNQGEYAGNRLLQRETIAAATALGYEGYDATVGKLIRWGYGFHLGGPEFTYGCGMGYKSTVRTFGFFGQRSSMVWADQDADLVVVLACNQLLSSSESKTRWRVLSDAVWNAVR